MKPAMNTLVKGGVFIMWSVVVLYLVSLLTLHLLGFQTTIVMSNSMSPILQTGDLVLLQKQERYEVGDVIQFSRGNSFFLHRIVEESENEFQTQGDANPIPDLKAVHRIDVHGEAIGVFRKFGMPIFQFREILATFSHSAFTTQTSNVSIANSRYWQTPAMSWNIISGTGSITFTAPNGVTFLNSGIRTIQSTLTNNATTKLYIEGRLTQKDLNAGGFQISTHTCLSTLSRPICGWVIHFDDTAKVVKLNTYQSNGQLSAVLASRAYTTSLSQNRKFVIETSPARIFVKLENEILLNVISPQVLASNNNALIPSGTRILTYFTGDNRFNANKFIIW